MTENQNPEQITDDVEGHGLRVKVALPQEPTGEDVEDAEGHAFKIRGDVVGRTDADDDVEGHATRAKV